MHNIYYVNKTFVQSTNFSTMTARLTMVSSRRMLHTTQVVKPLNSCMHSSIRGVSSVGLAARAYSQNSNTYNYYSERLAGDTTHMIYYITHTGILWNKWKSMQLIICARSLAEVESKPRLGLRIVWWVVMLRDFWNQCGSFGLKKMTCNILCALIMLRTDRVSLDMSSSSSMSFAVAMTCCNEDKDCSNGLEWLKSSG